MRTIVRWAESRIRGVSLSGFITIVYVGVLAWLPAFFGSQSCNVSTRPSMDHVHSTLDWVNCHLKFSADHRSLEAYAAWFAAVSASAAVYWAWRSFQAQSATLIAQSNTLAEQQRVTFLGFVRPIYESRLSHLALFIGMELEALFPSISHHASGRPADDITRAFALTMQLVAHLNVPGVKVDLGAVKGLLSSTNVNQFRRVAHDFTEAFNINNINFVLEQEPWYLLSKKLEEIECKFDRFNISDE